MKLPNQNQEKRYVLIDDDASFRAVLLRAAHVSGIHVDVFESLEELGAVGLLSRYDVAIVDYDLGTLNGLEIAQYLELLCRQTPMILVSGKDRTESSNQWPRSIKQFIPKSMGYSYILEQAEKCALENSENLLKMANAI
ncbi:MAG: response regulator [Chitinophagaceae bacterium]|nr:response regulator [Oligoflexus sp.]